MSANLLVLFLCLGKAYDILNIYQQAHYHIKSYLKHYLFNAIYTIIIPLPFIILAHFYNIVGYFLLPIIIIYSYFLFLKPKVKLKLSNRIKILIPFNLLIGLIFIIRYYYLFIFYEYLFVIFLYLNIIIFSLINKKYLHQAIKTASKCDKLVIGITGSAGKTSTKWLIYNILKEFYDVSTPDNSINTPLGIASFINNGGLNAEIIILEYGISKRRDMDKLLKIIKPNIGILTGIIPMHMDGFKNEKELFKEKIKLLLASKVTIANYDFKIIRDNIMVDYSFGINYGNNSFNIINDNPTSIQAFDCLFKSNLVGNIQAYNIMAMLCVASYLKLDLKIVSNVLGGITNYNHRLKIDGDKHIIIDDSYNSNIVGFKNALKTLKEQKGAKILLTQGIVELGKYKKSIYEELCSSIVYNADYCILVGKHLNRFYYLLKKFAIRVYLVSSFKEGFKLAKSISKSYEYSAILIENDLPDLYKIGFKI